MDLGLAGKRAAVAGASAGLGFASASALAAEGVTVAICGRNQDKVDAAVARLGAPAIGLVADVSTAAGGEQFVRDARDALGGLDILVPNAGGPPPGTFATTPLDEYAKAVELNLLSTVGMCHEAVPAMRAQGWGRVVAITSISVRQPIGTLILSNTARAGVTGFLKTLALEVAADGVTVNSVLPGLHETDRFVQLHGGDLSHAADGIPVGEIGRPADFGQVVAFLCSDHARHITGTALPVAGGIDKALL
jgi:3-oxoacyl-[acyl-carrier protein] reductase